MYRDEQHGVFGDDPILSIRGLVDNSEGLVVNDESLSGLVTDTALNDEDLDWLSENADWDIDEIEMDPPYHGRTHTLKF